MRLRTLLLILALIAVATSAYAQVFDLEREGAQMTELKGFVRFHTGDDPDGALGWASPQFADSRWPLLRSDQDWTRQGFKEYSGMAWYRFELIVPAGQREMALCIPRISANYQVFADGKLIGQFGGLNEGDRAVSGPPQIFPLPDSQSDRSTPVEIAIRVGPQSPASSGGGLQSSPLVGNVGLLNDWLDHWFKRRFWLNFSRSALTFLTLVAGVAGLVLFALRRNEREYLWFAAFELFNVLGYTLQNFADFHTVPALLFLLLDRFIWLVVNVIFVEFVRSALKARRDWLYWSAIGFQAATPLFGYVAHQLGLNGLAVEVAFTVLAISGSLATWALLYRGARSGNPDALLMLVPVGAFYLSVWSGEVSWLLQQFGLTGIENYRLWVRRITDWPFPISLTDITTTAWQLALFSILLLRFARTRREEQRMASELEAARAVQHILIPEEIPAIQGFQIQCVYKPAGEVGGDFFQIVPLPAGGALLAIGDVSGKGTPAAMMVSLLVGTLRTAIESSPSPAAILGAMNRRLIGRTAGGFATCLVLRVAANGAVTAANAGHLAPFVNGKEVPVDNSLPLGLEADTTYGESMLQLGPQDQLILMTDGVIEARNSNRELFGFDRAAAMAWESASEMAARAQQFGQEDDITIVRVVRQAPGEAAITRVDSTAWSPTAA